MQSPVEFLRKYHLPYVRRGNTLHLSKCPLCSKADTFTMHAVSGRWECEACNEAGSLYDLKVALGLIVPVTEVKLKLKELSADHIGKIEAAHRELLENKKKLDELYKWRGFGIEEVKQFRLGWYKSVTSDGDVIEYLVIPHFFNGKYYNAKLRTWVGYEKGFMRIPDQPTVLFNADVLLNSPKAILLTEAETDCIAAWKAGIKNAVSLTGGAKSGFPAVFIPYLEAVEKIIIAFDGDDAGRAGARKIAKQLGLHRCFIVQTPDGFDLNEYYQVNGKEALLRLVEKAVPAEVGDVESFSSVLERLELLGQEDTLLSTGFEELDNIIGGYDANGFFTTLTGLPKSGKTTLACALALEFAKRHGPAFIFCLEMEKEKIGSILASQLLLGARRPKQVEIGYVKAHLENIPLYHAFMGTASPEVVIETIREAFYRYGIQFVVFDNLHYLVRGVDNKASKLADLVKDFALLSRELGIIIMLIAQPKKVSRKKGQEVEMTSADIAWTSALESDSDLLLIINRPRIYGAKQTFSPIFKVVAEASRFAAGGTAYFALDDYSASVFPVGDFKKRSLDKFFNKVYSEGS